MRTSSLTLQNVKTLVETVERNTPGHLTEKILQNALVQEIRGVGLSCNQEVVLPVIYKGVFVGYNRFDILVTSGNPATPHITIIELKRVNAILSKDCHLYNKFLEQCRGYEMCAQRAFGDTARVSTYLVNINYETTKARANKIEVFSLDQIKDKLNSIPSLDTNPAPIKIKGEMYYEVERVLKRKKAAKNGEDKLLIRWAGFSSKHDSWEPESNIPRALVHANSCSPTNLRKRRRD